MDYDDLWKVLEEFAIDLKKRGEPVPPEILGDLKSAKTLINTNRMDRSFTERLSEIENYLGRVESNLLYLAETDFGREYAERYLRRISEARRRRFELRREEIPRFVHGIPRRDDWVRIKTKDLIPKEEIEQVAAELNLSYRSQKDGFLLIHGDKNKIRNLLRKVTERIRRKKEGRS